MDEPIGFRGRILHALSTTKTIDIPDGLLILDEGRIAACVPFEECKKPPEAIIDCSGKLLIPGFIDMHSHIPQLDCRGKCGETLLSWLDRYILPAEHAFSDLKTVDHVASRFFKKLILNGTTTAALFSSVHAPATNLCFELAKASGLRIILGKVMMDQHVPNGLLEETNESLRESERLCAKWHREGAGRLAYAFTPRFAPTCSERIWRETAKLVRQSNCYLHTHVAETVEENKRVQELFPQYDDAFALFEATECVGPKTIFAHAIHMSEGEYKRMTKAESKIAHCPTSNFFLKSGAFPLERVEKAGVVFGLGTDVGAGTSMSIMTEMRSCDFIQRKMPVAPAKAFYLATLGGAKGLDLGGEIGNFEIGKQGDFSVVDIQRIDPVYQLQNFNTHDLLSLLMYRGDGGAIEATYVGGEKLDVDIFRSLC